MPVKNTTENCYGAFAILKPKKKGGKVGKRPAPISAPWRPKAVANSFVYEQEDAEASIAHFRQRIPEMNAKIDAADWLTDKTHLVDIELGYLPKAGSAMVLLDLDHCVDPKSGKVADWAAEIIGDYSGPVLVTVSGTGYRIPQPRAEGDELINGAERNDVGFFGDGKKGATLPPFDASKVYRDQGMIDRLFARHGKPIEGADRGHDSDPLAWLHYDILTVEEMRDCLFSIPNEDIDREQWIGFMAALKRAYDASEEIWEVFDEWTEQAEDHTYDQEANRARWEQDLSSGTMSTGSIQYKARENGWVSPYADEAAGEVVAAGDDPVGYENPVRTATGLLDRFWYIKSRGLWLDRMIMETRTLGQVATETHGAKMVYVSDRGKVTPCKPGKVNRMSWLDSHTMQADDLFFDPQLPPMVQDRALEMGEWQDRPGWVAINTFRGLRVDPTKGNDASKFLHFMKWVWKDEAEMLLDWMAHIVQKPGVKINWAPYLVSPEGSGKDTMFAPLSYALSSAMSNIGYEAFNNGDFNGHWMDKKMVMLLQEPNQAASGREAEKVMGKLKNLVAAPPKSVEVNVKNKGQWFIANNICVAVVANGFRGVKFDATVRRYFVVETKVIPDKPYFDALWDWLDNQGGKAMVINHLLERDISGFDAKGRAPITKAFWSAVEVNKDQVTVLVEELVGDKDVVSTADLRLAIEEMTKRPVNTQHKILPALTNMGFRDLRLGDARPSQRVDGRKIRHGIWARKNIADPVKEWRKNGRINTSGLVDEDE